MLIPASNPAMAAKYAAAADGILFIGGGDVAPEHFGELPEPVPFDAEPKRDAFELALAKAAWEADIPMMGICRGMQVINIALGGSIYQDLEYAGFNRIDHRQHWDMKEGAHPIRIIDDRLAAITGSDTLQVNSSHHQAVKRVADVLIAAAVAPDDVTEAFVSREKDRYVLGVQWHPELMITDNGIFRSFVEAAGKKENKDV